MYKLNVYGMDLERISDTVLNEPWATQILKYKTDHTLALDSGSQCGMERELVFSCEDHFTDLKILKRI